MTTSPQDLQRALATAFNSQDIDALAALFHQDAVLVSGPGMIASGRAAIREALGEFLKIPGMMVVESLEVVEAADMALGKTAWQIEKDGVVAVEGQGMEVLRRGTNGSWLFVIDHPFGGASG